MINDNFTIYDAKYFNLLEKDHIDEQGHSIYKYQIKVNIDYAVPAVYFICGEGKNCSLLREYFLPDFYNLLQCV